MRNTVALSDNGSAPAAMAAVRSPPVVLARVLRLCAEDELPLDCCVPEPLLPLLPLSVDVLHPNPEPGGCRDEDLDARGVWDCMLEVRACRVGRGVDTRAGPGLGPNVDVVAIDHRLLLGFPCYQVSETQLDRNRYDIMFVSES